MDTYIPHNIRLIYPISKRFTYNQSFTSDELSTWVEQSQDIRLISTVSFLIVTYLGPFLFSIIFSNCIFPCPLLFLVIHSVHAGYLFCNWHSLNTNYLRTTVVGVPGSFNSDQIKCICCLNRPLFKVQSPIWTTEQWGTSPLPKGITQWPTEIVFSAITNCCQNQPKFKLLWHHKQISHISSKQEYIF